MPKNHLVRFIMALALSGCTDQTVGLSLPQVAVHAIHISKGLEAGMPEDIT